MPSRIHDRDIPGEVHLGSTDVVCENIHMDGKNYLDEKGVIVHPAYCEACSDSRIGEIYHIGGPCPLEVNHGNT